jgi:hypothetical protein
MWEEFHVYSNLNRKGITPHGSPSNYEFVRFGDNPHILGEIEPV